MAYRAELRLLSSRAQHTRTKARSTAGALSRQRSPPKLYKGACLSITATLSLSRTPATREVAGPRPWAPIPHDPSARSNPGSGQPGRRRMQRAAAAAHWGLPFLGSVPQGGTSDSPLRVLAVGPPWPHPCTGEVSRSPSSDPHWFYYPGPPCAEDSRQLRQGPAALDPAARSEDR